LKIKQHEHEHKHHHHSHAHVGENHNQSHSHMERNLRSIEELIDTSDLNQNVKDFSKLVFGEIARAEAKVHNKDINEVHFHEVGAIDSIVDIVGAAICIDLLGIKKVYSSPQHDGKGFIECQHGIIPVPVPAVMEMLKGSGIPIISEDINTELVTPTGMGIIKCLASNFGNMPAMIIDKVGYGLGKRETGRFNALRVAMGSLYEDDV
jgi:pyridinium-3,5-bisthiocarboxylic acid mononucleotide nickel chelatase